MTQKEANAKSQDKVRAIEAVCKQMQVTVSAEQVLTNDGFIKHIVFYTDNERYNIEEPKKNEPIIKDEKPVEEIEKDIPFLHEKNSANSI